MLQNKSERAGNGPLFFTDKNKGRSTSKQSLAGDKTEKGL
jgi:hypothetical protein